MTTRPIKTIDHLDTATPQPHEEGDVTYSKAYLIQTLQTLQEELGKAPTVADVRNLAEILPDVATYERRFGSWINALNAAGIEGAHNRSDEMILRQLADFALRLDRAPTKREVNADSSTASTGLYCNRFGSFSNAVRLALEIANETRAI